MSAVFLCFCFILKREEDSLVSSLFVMKQFFLGHLVFSIWFLVTGISNENKILLQSKRNEGKGLA